MQYYNQISDNTFYPIMKLVFFCCVRSLIFYGSHFLCWNAKRAP